MNPDRWRQVDELFDAALELPEGEREKFLKEACDGDEELRHEVTSLLEAHEKIDDFIESPAIELVGKAVSQKADNADSFIEREIGPYKIERLLGAGGMGEVYLARDTRLERKVALKILPSHFTLNKESALRFEREARAASALNHPNILTVYDIGQADDIRYIATEFIDGETLRERLKAGPMRAEDALDVALQITSALKAAHNAGIIHRDIKPENIMLRRDSIAKVLDFGLAKLMEEDASSNESGNITKKDLTATGAVMGTASYMSPEQALGLAVDHRSDIFSFGAVLYEMLTGKQPFKGATAAATFDAVLNRAPQPMAEIDEDAPVEFESIIEKALEKKVESRYQEASEMRADLKRLMRWFDSGTEFHATSAPHRSAKSKRFRSRRTRRQYLLIGLLGVAVIVFIAFVALRFNRQSETPKREGARNSLGKPSFTKLTSQSGEEIHPSLSPDGKTFLYASRESGNMDIYLQRVGEQTSANLTKDSKANETQPAFSNDGSKIAFAFSDPKGGVFVMDASGKSRRRLTDFGYNPAWSPDDEEIVFATDRVDALDARSIIPSELWIVNVATGEKRSLAVNDGVQPAWSPSGERIAYWSLKGGQRDVWTIPAKGGSPVSVTNDVATDGNPVWSPDGKYLYFASDRSGSMNFWRVAIDEKTGRTLDQPEPVTTPSSYSKHLSVARDGRHFAYVRANRNINLHTVAFDSAKEKAIDKPVAVMQGEHQVINSDLSPDGEWFAFGLQTENQEDIYVMKRDGAGLKKLTNDKHKDRSPRFSPDGKGITFFSDRSGRYEAWTINVESGSLEQTTFTGDGPGVAYSFWSRDGTRYVYNRWDNEPYIIDANKRWNEQTPQQLPEFPSMSGYFWARMWSPDGKKIGGWHIDGGAAGIVVYDFEKQAYERLTDYGDDPVWLNDSRRLLFRHQNKIFSVDSQNKKAKEVFSLSPQRITFFGLSQDNRTIFFSLLSAEAEIWLLTVE
jgi:serine/threonine protein kinase